MDVEEAKARCYALRRLLLRRDLSPSSKLSPSSSQTLLRLLDAELRFLSRLPASSCPVSPNVAHLAALLRALRHPSVAQVSRACRPVPTPSPVHVDAVCNVRRAPAWLFVSARNPTHFPWLGSRRDKGLRPRVEHLLAAARGAPLALRPSLVLLVFASGVGDQVASRLADEFGAAEIDFFNGQDLFEELEDGWVGVSAEAARVFEIKIGSACDERMIELRGLESGNVMCCYGDDGGDEFGVLISSMRPNSVDVVNFDTTALVAMVSGISNGSAERFLKAPEDEMLARFKGNCEFVIAQVKSELEHPILAELGAVIAGKKGMICQSVCSEFKGLVSMCGGPNEKIRADQLIKSLLVVPDSPSARLLDLPTTRKIALKNKVVFGTGDYWHAPTLTANMGFVRAISQTGMSLLTIEHRPLALTGD